MIEMQIRRLALILFISSLIYYPTWMWGSKIALSGQLHPLIHIGLLYIIPFMSAIIIAWKIGMLNSNYFKFSRLFLISIIGVVIPMIALQLTVGIACILSTECI